MHGVNTNFISVHETLIFTATLSSLASVVADTFPAS